MDTYKHYIRINEAAIIIHGYSDAFEQPQEGDQPLSGDYGRHFQIQLLTERGQYKYKLDNGEMVERTQAELDDEWNARPPAPPYETQILGQAISQREIEQIIQGQQISDMDIRLIKGGL